MYNTALTIFNYLIKCLKTARKSGFNYSSSYVVLESMGSESNPIGYTGIMTSELRLT